MAATTATVSERVRAALRAFPDFPKPGILFQDIFPLFSDPQLVQDVTDELVRARPPLVAAAAPHSPALRRHA